MSIEHSLLKSLTSKTSELATRDILHWCALAAHVMGIAPEDITPDNVDQIIDRAIILHTEDVMRLKGRHDYLTESKALPYERFSKAVALIWDGVSSRKVEAETGMGHQTQAEFNKWWRTFHDNYDSNDLRTIYHGFLQRNLTKLGRDA